MLIASKGKDQIVNTDAMCSIFVGNDNKVVAIAQNNKSIVVDTYGTRVAALTAVEMLAERIRVAAGNAAICSMPTEQEVKAYQNRFHQEKSRSMDGSKQKGHGGS